MVQGIHHVDQMTGLVVEAPLLSVTVMMQIRGIKDVLLALALEEDRQMTCGRMSSGHIRVDQCHRRVLKQRSRQPTRHDRLAHNRRYLERVYLSNHLLPQASGASQSIVNGHRRHHHQNFHHQTLCNLTIAKLGQAGRTTQTMTLAWACPGLQKRRISSTWVQIQFPDHQLLRVDT